MFVKHGDGEIIEVYKKAVEKKEKEEKVVEDDEDSDAN
jgi:hypothetical protein